MAAGGKKSKKDFKFQIQLGGQFKDFGEEEDRLLKRAYLIGHESARMEIRGQHYVYNFKELTQTNSDSGKHRSLRAPFGWKAPAKPLIPPGNCTIVTIKAGQPGKVIEIPNPNAKGEMIQVNVPMRAKVGAKMAVPIPAPGESMADVAKKQESQQAKNGWSTGGKVAAGMGGVALAGGMVVGGALLGDHLAGGSMAVDAAGAAGDFAGDAGAAIGDFAGDAGDVIGDAAGDVGDAVGDFADDAGDWLGDVAEDAGDWVVSLF